MINKQHSVLAVDLDHTLINTDFILEGIKFLISKKIYALPKLFFILIFNGKTYAKKYLYDNTDIEISSLPFNSGVINFIHQNKINYEHVILISGSYYRYVESVADYLGLFDSFSGTTTTVNMISFNKIKYLNETFKNLSFDYIGDSKKDVPIWERADNAFVVDNGNIINHIKHIDYKIISKE
tara:strand:- start:332 stop:877 length:546 start_codon:yes stop_codon:yes gene_type:complete